LSSQSGRSYTPPPSFIAGLFFDSITSRKIPETFPFFTVFFLLPVKIDGGKGFVIDGRLPRTALNAALEKSLSGNPLLMILPFGSELFVTRWVGRYGPFSQVAFFDFPPFQPSHHEVPARGTGGTRYGVFPEPPF